MDCKITRVKVINVCGINTVKLLHFQLQNKTIKITFSVTITYSPVKSSYRKIPMDQKSTAESCPRFRMTSGATYSGVPQKVQVFSPGFKI